tara:strand:+ start:921 stop:2234 length:1314 start_codon:yes stop_codon:yes gene_type:complete
MSKIIGIEKFINFPINRVNNYSFKNNNPLIQFRFESQSTKKIDPTSLRLHGVLRLQQGGVNQDKRPNNLDTNGSGAYASRLNDRVAVSSIIDILRLRNNQAEMIEEVKQYSQVLSIISPLQTSYDQFKTWSQNKFGSTANIDAQKVICNQDMEFSLPLRSGLLMNGQLLNLSSLGGLQMSILLNNDQQVLQGGGAAGDNGSYVVSDVFLSGDYYVFDSPQPPVASVIQYPAFNNFSSVLNSGDDSSSLQLAQRSVRSITIKSIPSSHLNNYNQDGFSTGKLQNTNAGGTAYDSDADVLEYTFLRGSVKYPKQYTTNERQAHNSDRYEGKKNRDFMNSVRPFYSYTNSLVSPVLQGALAHFTGDTKKVDVAAIDKPITGLAVNLDDMATGQGADYMSQVYSLRVVSENDGKSPNNLLTFTLSNQGLAVKAQGQVQPIQ